MGLKTLPPGETVGGQGRAYWVEKYFQWLFPVIYEQHERTDGYVRKIVDQQYGLVWFARGAYIRGFEGLAAPVNEELYELPPHTYFMVPMLKFIAHEGDNDGSNYGQLLNVARTMSDWAPIEELSITWGEEEKGPQGASYKRLGIYKGEKGTNGFFKFEGEYSPLEYYAETDEFYLSMRGYEQPSTRAVAAGYYIIFKIDQDLGKTYKIQVNAKFNYHWAQRHELMEVTDIYTLKVVPRGHPRYTDKSFQDKVKAGRVPFPHPFPPPDKDDTKSGSTGPPKIHG